MTTNAPEPLTPAESDLQDFPFMPLQVARLRDSDLAAEEAPEACWYAVLLWASSWHQLPAGSLPDNDTILMRLVGLGRDVKTWKRHRAGALRGFVTCSDGRLYHPVVAEQVNSAWKEKQAYRERKVKRTEIAKQAAGARWHRDEEHPQPMHEAMHEASETDASSIQKNARSMTSGMLKGTGTGTGTGTVSQAKPSPESKPEPSRARERDLPHRATDCLNEICTAARWHPRTDEARIEALSVVDGWLAEGFNLELVLAGIGRALAKKPGKTSSLKRFTTTIRGIHFDRGGGHRNGVHSLPRASADPDVAIGIRGLAQALAAKMAAE